MLVGWALGRDSTRSIRFDLVDTHLSVLSYFYNYLFIIYRVLLSSFIFFSFRYSVSPLPSFHVLSFLLSFLLFLLFFALHFVLYINMYHVHVNPNFISNEAIYVYG